MARRRVTVYAAFTAEGNAVPNLWHLDRARLQKQVDERARRGQALVPEHVVQITLWLYNRHRVAAGLPELDFSRAASQST